MDEHVRYMREALKEAYKALNRDEVPVGAIIVKDGKIIARGHNLRETNQCVIDHAEMIALKKASKKIGYWRLDDCVMYVTLEPCDMCLSAIQQARIKKVYFGAFDSKEHCKIPQESEGGILCEESSRILKDYFKMKRL